MEARAEHSAKRIVMLSIVTSSSHRLHCYYRILTIKRMRAGRRDFLLSRHFNYGHPNGYGETGRWRYDTYREILV